jgi:hypothetical protein
MLLTDSDILTPEALAAVDPEVSSPKIQEFAPPLEGPHSIISKTAYQACHFLTSMFQGFSGYLMAPGSSANHIAAVMNVSSTGISRPRVRMNQVVAEDPDPAKRIVRTWMEYEALYRFFQALFHRKMDDRFEKKMLHYASERSDAWSMIENCGLPVVIQPLPCPAAIREYNSGSWGISNVTAGGTGSTEAGNSYDVAIAYTAPSYLPPGQTLNGFDRGNGESAASAKVTIAAAAGQVLTVSIASLNPPTGMNPAVGTADGVFSQLPAVGWQVYVGLSGASLYLQNATPIPIATKTFTLPDAPVLSGFGPTLGQSADYNYAFVRTLMRA